ncbi:unnamed protein product [Brugia timori]|uniref:Uncharacterized protein n=1 Tax=Brugia timori TaxID=42155 RepID=A0A0R3R8B2_9BILA|nr:unnamed protein product [Brugia timori]
MLKFHIHLKSIITMKIITYIYIYLISSSLRVPLINLK